MSIPVLNVGQMREWEESTWKAGRSKTEVIRRVGHLVAERAHKMLKRGESVVAFHGSGNNGQDALQACRLFIEHEVHRIEAIHPAQALKEFESALALKPSLILDGIFGTGLNRALNEGFQKLIHAINQSGVPILAVDLPSGLNGDTGEPWGAAVKAQVTLTLGAPKRGLLSTQAWPYVGRLEVAPHIGLIDCPHSSDMMWGQASDFRWFPPVRPVDGHKGTFGRLGIIAGSLGYHGAAILAARGAQRAQTGLITLHAAPEVFQPIAAQLQSVMVRPSVAQGPDPSDYTCLLVGPGMAGEGVAQAARGWLEKLWLQAPIPMVADASALDLLPPSTAPAPGLRAITPHPGEAARMLGVKPHAIQDSRAESLRSLSKKFGDCWVVLKGCQTLIGRSDGPVFINPSGNPGLAQGGSGDLLAGWLAGLLAQPLLQSDPHKTLRYGVWRHGFLADELERERPHWTIEDLSAFQVFPEKHVENRPNILPEVD
ncbi:MAG: NAD(P)H-hydrate dehydratase [Verrucomicrobia bacterium]|nr:NAD(P)H-hydrate dehydratase [Verrucomicrobiota bacterium]